jgi:hypothetical protein
VLDLVPQNWTSLNGKTFLPLQTEEGSDEEEQVLEEQLATAKTTAEDVPRALSLVMNSRPVLGTVRNKAGQMPTTPASMRKLFSH